MRSRTEYIFSISNPLQETKTNISKRIFFYIGTDNFVGDLGGRPHPFFHPWWTPAIYFRIQKFVPGETDAGMFVACAFGPGAVPRDMPKTPTEGERTSDGSFKFIFFLTNEYFFEPSNPVFPSCLALK